MSNSLFRRKDVKQAIKETEDREDGNSLAKVLGVRDLTYFGIAAIIGGGIFSTIGEASFSGGPAVSMLFVFIAIACVFTALSYAQFASTVPVSGSAYTYAFVTFGELFAWIIGWALILEYAVSNMVIAISWSSYFIRMLEGFGIHWAEYLATDFLTAKQAYLEVVEKKLSVDSLIDPLKFNYNAYVKAPTVAGIKIILNIPAFVVTALITWLVYVGIKETRNAGNALVIFKLIIIIAIILGGVFFVKTENWTPFLPNGMGGVLASISAVFFTFIGFDSISTTAEECKNPQRDLPRAMIYSLIICTVLYVAITFVLTGMVSYKELKVAEPMAFVFDRIGFHFIAGVIAVSAVIAMTSALLAYQVGQPRIWMTMSRDGLLPKRFGKIHEKYRTPAFSTIITGILVGVPSLFLQMKVVTDLTSVGTLFAFILVCAGILYMDESGMSKNAKFKVPYINGRLIAPILFIVIISLIYHFKTDDFYDFFKNQKIKKTDEIVELLNNPSTQKELIESISSPIIKSNYQGNITDFLKNLENHNQVEYRNTINNFSALTFEQKYHTGLDAFERYILLWIFLSSSLLLTYLSVRKKYSLLPVLGILTNLYLMTEVGISNWIMFVIWLGIGLVIYFAYGYKHSKLAKK